MPRRDLVPGVYGPENGTRFRRVVRSLHHGVATGTFVIRAAANAAGVMQPSALCG